MAMNAITFFLKMRTASITNCTIKCYWLKHHSSFMPNGVSSINVRFLNASA